MDTPQPILGYIKKYQGFTSLYVAIKGWGCWGYIIHHTYLLYLDHLLNAVPDSFIAIPSLSFIENIDWYWITYIQLNLQRLVSYSY